MDNKKKIEIPFGAFDSELIHQEINIPNGFKAVIDGNKIILTKVESEDEKIKNALIRFHKSTIDIDGIKGEDIISWLEKQGEEQPIIRWHSINEEPEDMKELFCEWDSDDATWHDVAFYDKESHTFRHAKMPINVTQWVYVDELLEKQGEQKSFDYENANIQQRDWAEIPFGTKDSELQEVSYHIPEGFHAEIDGNRVVIKKGEQKSAWSEDDERKIQDCIDAVSRVNLFKVYYQNELVEWLKSIKERIGG